MKNLSDAILMLHRSARTMRGYQIELAKARDDAEANSHQFFLQRRNISRLLVDAEFAPKVIEAWDLTRDIQARAVRGMKNLSREVESAWTKVKADRDDVLRLVNSEAIDGNWGMKVHREIGLLAITVGGENPDATKMELSLEDDVRTRALLDVVKSLALEAGTFATNAQKMVSVKEASKRLGVEARQIQKLKTKAGGNKLAGGRGVVTQASLEAYESKRINTQSVDEQMENRAVKRELSRSKVVRCCDPSCNWSGQLPADRKCPTCRLEQPHPRLAKIAGARR
jgi:hypothetical protein